MRPKFRVEINGKPMSEGLWRRLISLSISDKEGLRSDTLDLELDDGPPEFLELPSKRAEIRVWGGYEGAQAYFGAFKDADVTVSCLPYKLKISAKAADMKDGLKTPQERHWDGATVGDVFSTLAAENGLAAQISPEIAAMRFSRDWAGMQNESVLGYGARVADRVGAQFQIKDQKLIMVPKGQALTASGKALTALEIGPDVIAPGSCSFEFSARGKYGTVRASFQDAANADRRSVTAPSDASSAEVFTIREPFGSREEAEAAARAKARELAASADTAKASIVGNVLARGGAPFVFKNVRPGLDGVPFIIETATHKFSKGAGYVTEIQGKAKR